MDTFFVRYYNKKTGVEVGAGPPLPLASGRTPRSAATKPRLAGVGDKNERSEILSP